MIEGSTSPVWPEASPYSRHLPALDGVRGLAILFVMCSHFFPGTAHNRTEQIIQSMLGFGSTGVDLFFVLSGFLITGILYDSLHDEHFFRKFYARRALRILPLYYGVIAAYAIVGIVQRRSSHGELLSLVCYLQNTNLIAPNIYYYAGPLFLPLGHFWSLAIEEQFYLVWPLFVFLLRTRTRILILCGGLIVLCPVLRSLAWSHGAYLVVHANTLCRADSLAVGGALSLLLRSRWHDKVLSVAPWLFLVIPFSLVSFDPHLLSASSVQGASLAFNVGKYSILALGYAGLIALALGVSTPRRLFSTKPMRFLGKYSYGLYVLHLILLGYFADPLRNALHELNVGKGVSVLIVGTVGFAVSIVAAVLSYQLYERHFLRLKRFFDYRPHGPAAAASSRAAASLPEGASASPALHRS